MITQIENYRALGHEKRDGYVTISGVNSVSDCKELIRVLQESLRYFFSFQKNSL